MADHVSPYDLFLAAEEGDARIVAQAVQDDYMGVDSFTEALRLAAKHGHAQCVELLLLGGGDPYANNSVPLTRAAMNGHIECVQALVDVSDVNACSGRAVELAARRGHLACLAVMLPYANPVSVRTALVAAVEHRELPCVDFLLTYCDQSALEAGVMVAVRHDNAVCLERLLHSSTYAAHPKQGTSLYTTAALFMAARDGFTDIVDLLIVVCDVQANKSEALRVAAKHGHTDVVARLIPLSDVQAKNSEALREAVQNNHHACIDLLYPFSNAHHVLGEYLGGNHSGRQHLRALVDADILRDHVAPTSDTTCMATKSKERKM